MSNDAIILIPARLAATRLPNKPLLKINGSEMIKHAWDIATAAKVGRVVVAAGDQAIVDTITNYGGEAILTPTDLISGTDRIHYALEKLPNHQQYQKIINLQADMPNLNPAVLKKIAHALDDGKISIITPLVREKNHTAKYNPHDVKAVCHVDRKNPIAKVLYFSRAPIPYGNDSFLHHVGVYGFQRQALDNFVKLPISPLEKLEKLEQLRALENNIDIYGILVDDRPLSVDTPEDLSHAIATMKNSCKKI